MAFSQDGSRLAVVCNDNEHMITVFNTTDPTQATVIASDKGGGAQIYDIDFSPDNDVFVAVGAKLFK